MNLPHFAEFWQDIDVYDTDESEDQPHEIELVNEYGEIIIMNALWISVTDLDYPRVLAFAPLNHKKDAKISTDLMLT